MGGIGSGGSNRTHEQAEHYFKVDSFAFNDFLKGDKYLYYKDRVIYPQGNGCIAYVPQTDRAEVCFKGGYSALELSKVTNIDGITQRLYFICPECGRRARYLYKKHNALICRKCAKLNYESQQRNGLDRMLCKMHAIVEKKLGYAYWWREHPGVILPELQDVPKPRYMRWEKYNALMQELRLLQRKYILAEMKKSGFI